MTSAHAGPNQRLRVLHVLAELRPSGAEIMLELAGPLWARHDIDAQIVSIATERGAFAGRLSAAGYKVHLVSPAPRLAMLRRFRDLLADEAIDVVHIHVEGANFWFGLIARAHGVGVVATHHNCFAFTGTLRAERIVQRAVSRKIGVRYVSIGASVAAHEAARFFNPTTTIANWFDIDRFRPPDDCRRANARRSYGLDAEFVVATVGNCSKVKNHELLMRALALCDSLDFVFVHAGDDSGSCGAHEKQLSHVSGLAARVRFLGPVEDVSELLHAADVFVMPSFYEGLSIAALEALACGLPLVLTDVPGLRDIGAFGGDVRYVELEPADMANAILLVAREPRRSDAPVQRGLDRRRRSELAPSTGVDRYARVYRESASGPAWLRLSGKR